VIRSVLEHVYERESGIVTVIPEAWEFLPEQRGSPVRLAFETLVRKGAALQNFVWLDSQDLAGVWKLAVRACSVILVGVQREANEIKRTLANIPASVAKPTATDLATLGLGEFVACWSKHAIKTYVQPAWMAADAARQVARGTIDARNAAAIAGAGVMRRAVAKAFDVDERQLQTRKEPTVTKGEADELRRQAAALTRENDELKRRLAALEGTHHDEDRARAAGGVSPRHAAAAGADRAQRSDADRSRAVGDRSEGRRDHAAETSARGIDVSIDEALYQTIKARLIADVPAILLLLEARPELEVNVERRTIQANGETTLGRVARLIKRGELTESKRFREILLALERTGTRINNKSLSVALQELVVAGFLVKESVDRYVAVPDMAIRVVES
jgi:hypothetical protein